MAIDNLYSAKDVDWPRSNNSFGLDPILSQPALPLLIIRHGPLHPLPELGRAMWFVEMREFMHHHILQSSDRGKVRLSPFLFFSSPLKILEDTGRCSTLQYICSHPRRIMMASTKTATVTFRINPAVKEALRTAAAREHRSIANMVEVLIRDYCGQSGIAIPERGDLHDKHKSD